MHLELNIAWLEENGVEVRTPFVDYSESLICAIERVGTWDVYLMENESMIKTFQVFCKNRKRWFIVDGNLLK